MSDSIENICTKRVKGYFLNIFMAGSHFLAALIGADHRIPFSSQCGYWYINNKWRGRFFVPFIDFAFWLFNNREIDHCVDSWKHTRKRIHILETHGLRNRKPRHETQD